LLNSGEPIAPHTSLGTAQILIPPTRGKEKIMFEAQMVKDVKNELNERMSRLEQITAERLQEKLKADVDREFSRLRRELRDEFTELRKEIQRNLSIMGDGLEECRCILNACRNVKTEVGDVQTAIEKINYFETLLGVAFRELGHDFKAISAKVKSRV
jgi:BMFP domain-containing protein YqiC